jgi:hypothetical protein
MSNNHLLVERRDLLRTIRSMCAGDQVKISGKLVNVKARLVGKRGAYDSSECSWNTSACRTDSGAGACEVIYVEDVVILRRANALSYYAFLGSMWGMLLLMGWGLLDFFLSWKK